MTAAAAHRWQARPGLALVLRAALLAVPLVASSAAVYGLVRWVPQTARTWWGLAALLLVGLLVASAVERAARRLLPIALLLKLSMIFPDRAPSRFQLARAAATRRPSNELLWTGHSLQPTSTADLVLALVSALGTHDRRTRGHSERVRLLCDMLAAELKLDPDARERLRWAALLHDVGKVEVSSRILNKPSRLTGPEAHQVRLHPQAGAALAAPLLPWLGSWGDGILDHHEKYDGTGYPHGKAGDEISVAGRLIAVVDAFETMTATRPYKRAVVARTAREELARCAGTHFDPVYVRAFLAISLPRLFWTMGPLAFLLQLPFLQPLAQSGARTTAAAPQAASAVAASAVAGAAVLTGSVTATTTDSGSDPGRDGRQQVAQQQDPARDGQAPGLASTAPSGADEGGTQAAPPAAGGLRATAPPAPTAAPETTAAPGDVTRGAGTRGETAGPVAAAPPPPPAAEPQPEPGRPAATADPGAGPPGPEQRPDEEHAAIVAGPPRTTSSRRAAFELRDVQDVRWECQLRGAADGSPSRWKPCSGTFTVTVERDGDQVLRVRDADTREQVDAWEWTVTD